jgi:hypothetical protein
MKRLVFVLLALLALLMVAAGSASANFGLREVDAQFRGAGGEPASEAGSHPFEFSTNFEVNTTVTGSEELPDGELRDLRVAQMPGFVGAQGAVPVCSSADFNNRDRIVGRPACSDNSAVGIVAVKGEFAGRQVGDQETFHVPLYYLAPSPGEAAKLGFVALNVPISIDVGVNTQAPYNLVAKLDESPQGIQLFGSKVTLWGDPASPAHDELRGKCLGEPLVSSLEPVSLGSCPYTASPPHRAFLTLPRACEGPLQTIFTADSWESPGAFTDPKSPTTPFAATDCGSLSFGPTIAAGETNHAAESPSGLDFDLEVDDPGLSEPGGRADSDIERAVVTLPEGFTTNPSVANGLGACSLAQYEEEAPRFDPGRGCPQSSNIGSVEVTSPLLEERVKGQIYVARQGENVFHSLLALYMILRSEKNGILVRQPIEVEPDPVSGRLRTTVREIPQLPFSDFHLHFREGPRAPLITPAVCGDYTVAAQLFPYADPAAPVSRTASLGVHSGAGGAPCAASTAQLPNAPDFSAGTIDPTAGAYSPFVFGLKRPDGSQQISSISATLPQGLLGKLAGVSYCPDSDIAKAAARGGEGDGALEIAAPSCPPGSEVGTVTVGAGAGPEPFYVTGHVYLAGPYRGAPISLEIVTPAIAGPFDLGVVAVRTALRVDPLTAQITADSDPIPAILHGLPLDLRSISIDMSRPAFTLNPTSCEPKSILGSLTSANGSVAQLSQYFQARSCASLAFEPALSLKLLGSTQRGKNPALKATLTQPAGQANIGRVSVVLPKSEFIDNRHINSPCTRVQFNAGAGNGSQCPPKSILGTARAFTPLLDQPLEGPVYFRSNGGERELPDLVASLDGQVHLNVVGFIDSVGKKGSEVSRVRSTFAALPDAPVSKFVLQLKGGKRGLLQNSANLCKAKNLPTVKLDAQNGRFAEVRKPISDSCRAGGKKKHRRRAS